MNLLKEGQQESYEYANIYYTSKQKFRKKLEIIVIIQGNVQNTGEIYREIYFVIIQREVLHIAHVI